MIFFLNLEVVLRVINIVGVCGHCCCIITRFYYFCFLAQSSTVRPRCRVVQSRLPWRQCAELPAAAPASTVTEIGKRMCMVMGSFGWL